ncbi:MAG: ATP-binding protein, partial [Gemmatimonadota bacterium]|nr:ATP-binding protein [Gemmatimonadota bacterium]
AETVANALDSGATSVRLHTDPAAGTFTVADDGKGMSRRSLSNYHDLAVTTKQRGRGIGFAGVGIKLGLLLSHEVVTETRTPRTRTSLATSWRLASRTRAPWRWIEPPGLLDGAGTMVRLYLSNPLSPLTDRGFVEAALLRHFETLFHGDFDEILSESYPSGVRFFVNGPEVPRTAPTPGRVRIEVRIGRQRKPSGVGFLRRDPDLADEERGVAISTMGKVIGRGWDWLGIVPTVHDVSGLVEVPALAAALTLNKADFIRSGPRGATFLAYRKALQEAVAMQLESWGDSPADGRRPRRARSLERDLQSVLSDLAGNYPLLATLVERTRGGQRRLPLGGDPSPAGVAPGAIAGLAVPDTDSAPSADAPAGEGAPAPTGGQDIGAAAETGAESESDAGREAALPDPPLPGTRGRKAPQRLGLRVRFGSRPDDPALGWLVESTVWVNEAHPAFGRAAASRSEGYHVALSVAMALAAVAVEPARAREFVGAFLARWGEVGRPGRRKT